MAVSEQECLHQAISEMRKPVSADASVETLLFHQRGPAGTDMLTDASLTILFERLIRFSGGLGLFAAILTR
jgi:hypothetical protein